MTDTATPIARSLATRRRLLARFVDQLNVLSSTLADRSQQLGNAVSAGSDTLAVTAEGYADSEIQLVGEIVRLVIITVVGCHVGGREDGYRALLDRPEGRVGLLLRRWHDEYRRFS